MELVTCQSIYVGIAFDVETYVFGACEEEFAGLQSCFIIYAVYCSVDGRFHFGLSRQLVIYRDGELNKGCICLSNAVNIKEYQ